MNNDIVIYELTKCIEVLAILAKHTNTSQFVTIGYLANEIDRLNNIIKGLTNETTKTTN